MHVVMIELLAPQQSGECLALHEPLVIRGLGIGQGPIESVRFGHAPVEQRVEAGPERRRTMHVVRQTQTDHTLTPRRNGQPVACRRLGAFARGIDRLGSTVHDVLVKRILDVGAGIWRSI
jgi:hypothetical protein